MRVAGKICDFKQTTCYVSETVQKRDWDNFHESEQSEQEVTCAISNDKTHDFQLRVDSVSYTHLTLPTNREV